MNVVTKQRPSMLEEYAADIALAEERQARPLFIKEKTRKGVGQVAIFTDGEKVIRPERRTPANKGARDYYYASKLIDALVARNKEEITRSKREYKHRIDENNLVQYVA